MAGVAVSDLYGSPLPAYWLDPSCRGLEPPRGGSLRSVDARRRLRGRGTCPRSVVGRAVSSGWRRSSVQGVRENGWWKAASSPSPSGGGKGTASDGFHGCSVGLREVSKLSSVRCIRATAVRRGIHSGCAGRSGRDRDDRQLQARRDRGWQDRSQHTARYPADPP